MSDQDSEITSLRKELEELRERYGKMWHQAKHWEIKFHQEKYGNQKGDEIFLKKALHGGNDE